MDSLTFQQLLTNEVAKYKSLLETENSDWIVKGFIDINDIHKSGSENRPLTPCVALHIVDAPRTDLDAQPMGAAVGGTHHPPFTCSNSSLVNF